MAKTAEIKIKATDEGTKALLKGIKQHMEELSETAKTGFGSVDEAGKTLSGGLRDISKEVKTSHRAFLGLGGQLAALSGESKNTTVELLSLGASVLSGNWLGAGVAAAALFSGTISELRGESKKAQEEALKYWEQTLQIYAQAKAIKEGKSDEQEAVAQKQERLADVTRSILSLNQQLSRLEATRLERLDEAIAKGLNENTVVLDEARVQQKINDLKKEELKLQGDLVAVKDRARAADEKSTAQEAANAAKKDATQGASDAVRDALEQEKRLKEQIHQANKVLNKDLEERAARKKRLAQEALQVQKQQAADALAADMKAIEAEEKARATSAKRGEQLLKKELQESAKAYERFASFASQSMADMMTGDRSPAEVLKEVGKDALKNLISMALTQIMVAAGVGSANAFAQTCATGPWGFLAAPGVAASVTGTIAAMAGMLPSFHTGGEVPGTGDVLAVLQGGERVLSRDEAQESRGDVHVHLNISAMDARSVERTLMANQGALLKTIAAAARNRRTQ